MCVSMPVLLSHRQHIAIAIGLLCNTSCIAEILMGLFQRFLLGSWYLASICLKDKNIILENVFSKDNTTGF